MAPSASSAGQEYASASADEDYADYETYEGDYLDGDYDEDWHQEYDEYIEHDEHGVPVVVAASGYGRGYQTVTPSNGQFSRAAYKRRQAKRRRRNITLTVALAGFAVLLVAFVVIVQQLLDTEPNDYETQAGDTVQFEVYSGEGISSVRNRLVEEDIIASSDAFQDALEDSDLNPRNLHPDTYEMSEQMPAADALHVLLADESTEGYVSINAGWRIDQTLAEIAEGTGTDLAEVEALNEDPQRFGVPEQAQDLEGFLAVGEHRFDVDASAEEVIQELVDETLTRLEDEGVTDPDEQWETIIVASLLTAEANNTISEERDREERLEDYRTMAGAIHNRIDNPSHQGIGGLLQIDATVNYGLGLSGDLHFPEEERDNPDNEYNTYVHPGLPPGPIAAPIQDTIAAAADPAETDAYFWVTVNPVTGETRFNEWLEDHEADREEFEQFCEETPDACGSASAEAEEGDPEQGED